VSDMSDVTPAENDEVITAEEARKRLGVSKNKMAEWFKYHVLPFETSQLDSRVKLVRIRDVEHQQRELAAQRKREGRGRLTFANGD